MSQNVGKKTYEPKTEPVNRPVSPGAVSRLGNMVGPGTPFKTLEDGRGGLKAPMAEETCHHSGSQGRH